VEYAVRRTVTHLDNFLRLYNSIVSGHIDEGVLFDLEEKNNIFPHLDYRWYAQDKPAEKKAV